MSFSVGQNKVTAILISRWPWGGAPPYGHGTLGSTVCCLHTFQISKTERDLGNIRLIGWSRLQLAGAENEVQKLSKEEINLNAWEEEEKWKNEELAWDRLLFVLCAKLLRHACRQVLTYSKNPRIRTSIFLKLHSICSYIIFCSTVTPDIKALSLKLKLLKHRHFLTSLWLWFQFSSISFGKIFWYAQNGYSLARGNF